MKEITRINHVGLRVRDLKTSTEFYEKLGFKFIIGPVGPEPAAVIKHPSGININFILNASEDASKKNILSDMPVKHTGFTHIALEITDPDSVIELLSKESIDITETINLPDGTHFFFVRDPDGNVIEFHCPATT